VTTLVISIVNEQASGLVMIIPAVSQRGRPHWKRAGPKAKEAIEYLGDLDDGERTYPLAWADFGVLRGPWRAVEVALWVLEEHASPELLNTQGK
jgi:hypothetical protein